MTSFADIIASLPSDGTRTDAERISALRHEVLRRQRREDAIVREFRCYICTLVLPEEAFARSRNRPNGRNGACRACMSARAKAVRLAKRTNTPPS